MVKRIEYRKDGRLVLFVCNDLPETADQASIVAQRFMNGTADVDSAHIFHGDIERVVSRSTAWMKGN